MLLVEPAELPPLDKDVPTDVALEDARTWDVAALLVLLDVPGEDEDGRALDDDALEDTPLDETPPDETLEDTTVLLLERAPRELEPPVLAVWHTPSTQTSDCRQSNAVLQVLTHWPLRLTSSLRQVDAAGTHPTAASTSKPAVRTIPNGCWRAMNRPL